MIVPPLEVADGLGNGAVFSSNLPSAAAVYPPRAEVDSRCRAMVPGLERVLRLVGRPAGVGGVALLHQGSEPLGELGPGAGAEVHLGGQAVPAVAVVTVFGVVLGGQLLDEPTVERGVEAVLFDRSPPP